VSRNVYLETRLLVPGGYWTFGFPLYFQAHKTYFNGKK